MLLRYLDMLSCYMDMLLRYMDVLICYGDKLLCNVDMLLSYVDMLLYYVDMLLFDMDILLHCWFALVFELIGVPPPGGFCRHTLFERVLYKKHVKPCKQFGGWEFMSFEVKRVAFSKIR